MRLLVMLARRIALPATVMIVLAVPWAFADAPSRPGKELIDYRNPPRAYERVAQGDFVVFVERELFTGAPDMARRAMARLEENRRTALSSVPARFQSELRDIPLYLMYGPRARGGGESNGLQYFPSAAPDFYPNADLRWRNAVVIHSADNYARITDFWALKALAHEYAHAHHLIHWRPNQPEILSAWQNAMAHGLYRDSVDEKGIRHELAYAGVNQLEYFAELSSMTFVGGNYYPHSRAELERYDPVGAEMIRTMWGVGNARIPPNSR